MGDLQLLHLLLPNQHILDLCHGLFCSSFSWAEPASPEPAWLWAARLLLVPAHELKAHCTSAMQLPPSWGGVTHTCTPMGHHYQRQQLQQLQHFLTPAQLLPFWSTSPLKKPEGQKWLQVKPAPSPAAGVTWSPTHLPVPHSLASVSQECEQTLLLLLTT